jgi:hypothetical protein
MLNLIVANSYITSKKEISSLKTNCLKPLDLDLKLFDFISLDLDIE